MDKAKKLRYISADEIKNYELIQLISIKMRNQRAIHGLSQEGLANEAGIDRAYVGQVERCEKNITVKTLAKITRSFGLEVHEFLDFSDLIRENQNNFIKK